MAKVKLIDPSLGPKDGKILPIMGGMLVTNGEVIDVPSDVAGVGPYWRAPKDGDEFDFLEVKRDESGTVTSVHDLGYGLLAQVGHWEKADDAPKEG